VRRAVLALLLLLPLLGVATPADATAGATADRRHPAVIGVELLGHSVKGRKIRAWHLGDPHARTKVVLISTMHGDESAPSQILTSLRNGAPVRGIDLWVVPTYNPDGRARHTRQNAHGVDLNRNYPTSWRRVTGRYDSGSEPASEPETKAMMRFLRSVRPDYVVSFHQPLHGVDTLTKHPAFSHRLARALRLPVKRFSCDGGCHGTMTMWFNKQFAGQAVTVEFGSSPSRRELRGPVVRRLLRLFHAHR
jgi:murein peptide amidase A